MINQGTFAYNSGAFSGRLTNVGTAIFNADFTAGNGMENDAGLSLPSGRVITLNGLGLDNQGSLTLTGGTLNLSTSANAANVNRGTINLAVSAPLKLNAATLQNIGTLNLNGGTITGTTGLLSNGPGGMLSGSGAVLSPFANAGGVIAISTGTLSVSQPFTNTGLIQLATFTANLIGGPITSSGVINGIGSIGNNITNTGTIEAIGTLTLAGAVTNSASGRILAPSGSKILFTAAGANNSGKIILQGGTIESAQPLTNNSAGTISGIGSIVVGGAGLTNNGSIALSGAGDLFGKLNNATGVSTKGVAIATNSTIAFWDAVTNSPGSLFEVAVGSTATFAGPYTGAGISGPGQVIFADNISPGPGKTTFGGNVAVASTAKLQIEIAGTAPGSQFDQVQVAGRTRAWWDARSIAHERLRAVARQLIRHPRLVHAQRHIHHHPTPGPQRRPKLEHHPTLHDRRPASCGWSRRRLQPRQHRKRRRLHHLAQRPRHHLHPKRLHNLAHPLRPNRRGCKRSSRYPPSPNPLRWHSSSQH